MKTKHDSYPLMFAAVMVAGFLYIMQGVFPSESVQARADFTNASLQGSWGFTFHQAGSEALNGYGVMIADGQGKVTGSETAHASGTGLVTRAFRGAYSVKPDGTGTLEVNYSGPGQAPSGLPSSAAWGFVLVKGKTEFRAIRTSGSSLVTADFRIQ